ncbi:HlyD family secretion protein [Shewanella sp. NIFS-20-20]|uniref:HlyD family secretion protein n=1 Tax=Shewanella sp. NIFS-20-20 TaxID=2853806 RepID=UPI001C473CBF|nr:HlyD family secretion protein [Shewanella sp. NIFS-20-20]MBV7314523.1 HlyD family secretion protein [Shewanella sp. NIFS-20-20]
MSEQQETNETHAQSATIKSSKRLTWLLLITVVVIWIYTLWADRVTPMTTHARVNAQLIQLTPQVSADISQILVANNANVTQGQPLITLDNSQAQLNVIAARLNLQQTSQALGADSAGIAEAQANLVTAKIKQENSSKHAERMSALGKNGVVSTQAMEDSQDQLKAAQAQLAQAQAALIRAKTAMGPEGKNNPQLQAALNQLNQALLNESYTKIYAPDDGVITNLTLAAGNYAIAGHPLVTFINNQHTWVTAMLRENSLIYLKPGTPVKIVFDAYPGQTFHGSVASIGWGSSGNGNLQTDQATGLFISPTGQQHPQRFPVNINLDNDAQQLVQRYGGRAMVSFYPDQSSLGEGLLSIWTWVWSYLTYVS